MKVTIYAYAHSSGSITFSSVNFPGFGTLIKEFEIDVDMPEDLSADALLAIEKKRRRDYLLQELKSLEDGE